MEHIAFVCSYFALQTQHASMWSFYLEDVHSGLFYNNWMFVMASSVTNKAVRKVTWLVTQSLPLCFVEPLVTGNIQRKRLFI